MYCQHCGTKVGDNDSFCKNCGKSLNGTIVSEMSQETATVEEASENERLKTATEPEIDTVTDEEIPKVEEPQPERVVWKDQPVTQKKFEEKEKKKTRMLVTAVLVGGLAIFLIVSCALIGCFSSASKVMTKWRGGQNGTTPEIESEMPFNNTKDWNNEEDPYSYQEDDLPEEDEWYELEEDPYWDEDESTDEWDSVPGESGTQGDSF